MVLLSSENIFNVYSEREKKIKHYKWSDLINVGKLLNHHILKSISISKTSSYLPRYGVSVILQFRNEPYR